MSLGSTSVPHSALGSPQNIVQPIGSIGLIRKLPMEVKDKAAHELIKEAEKKVELGNRLGRHAGLQNRMSLEDGMKNIRLYPSLNDAINTRIQTENNLKQVFPVGVSSFWLPL